MKMARTTTTAAAAGAATHEAHQHPSPSHLRTSIPPPWFAVPAAEPSIASPWSPSSARTPGGSGYIAEQPSSSPRMSASEGRAPMPMPQETSLRGIEEQEEEQREEEQEHEQEERRQRRGQKKEAKRLRGGCIPCPDGSICYIIPIPCCCF